MEDDNAPVTKADLRGLAAQLERVETNLERVQTNVERVETNLERVETNLLTEFHKWAQTYEVRARGTTRAVYEFDERLGLMEERISRLERGGRT